MFQFIQKDTQSSGNKKQTDSNSKNNVDIASMMEGQTRAINRNAAPVQRMVEEEEPKQAKVAKGQEELIQSRLIKIVPMKGKLMQSAMIQRAGAEDGELIQGKLIQRVPETKFNSAKASTDVIANRFTINDNPALENEASNGGGDYYGYVEDSYDFSKKYWRLGFNDGLGINATFHVAGRVNIYQSNGEYMVDAYLSAAGAPTKMNTIWNAKVQVYDGKELVGTLDLRKIPNNDITYRTEIGRTTFNLPTDLGKDVYIKFDFGYSILNPEGLHPITNGSYKFRVNRYYKGFIY